MAPSRKCAVCGDKALGYNFNAVTCESCKAFFRRNALAKKSFSCPFNEKCEINVVTRRFCQKCRLQKCLGIGMKVENIMSEEDKQLKRRKIENNREKRHPKNERDAPSKCSGKQHEGEANHRHDDVITTQLNGKVDDTSSNCSTSNDPTPTEIVEASGKVIDNDCRPTTVVMEPNTTEMSAEQMVDYILSEPERALQAINKLMRNSSEALTALEKIIHSQKDALRLIAHLINYPGNGRPINTDVP